MTFVRVSIVHTHNDIHTTKYATTTTTTTTSLLSFLFFFPIFLVML